MDDLVAAVDWTQVPAALAVIGLFVARAWQSRELVALRERITKLDEELFEETRRHNATKRRCDMLRDELSELRGAGDDADPESSEG